jgi:hypothetical protein
VAELLMVVPTRGRPHAVAELWAAWSATATGAAELLLAIDDDDPHREAYQTAAAACPGVAVRVGPRLRMVGTLNAAALEHADRYRCLGFMGDDHRPRTRGWDARFAECLSAGAGICYGNDLLQGEAIPTAVAMTADIVTALGYMAPPAMTHLCVDLVWKDWGQAMGRITYLPDVILEHLHPAVGKAALDAGYTEANSAERVAADSAAYYAYRDGAFHDDVATLKGLL